MRKLFLSLTALSIAVAANAQFTLIPNGDFSSGNTGWVEANGGSAAVFSYPATGGVGNSGYGQIAEPGGGWAVLVSPPEAGNIGGGWDIATLGVTAGVTNTFSIDLKTFSGTAAGGLKVEAWAGNAIVGNSGDVNAPAILADGNWNTFTFDWLVPAATEKMIIVPLWGAGSTVGYDNVGVGVVPEPSTFALLGGLLAFGYVVYRRRK